MVTIYITFMGGANVKFRKYIFVPDSREPGQNEESILFLKETLLFSNSQLRVLHGMFRKSKCATNDMLSLKNCLQNMKLAMTPFNYRALGNMQPNHASDLNFLEFVVGLWNFMTLTDADMKAFVFLIFNLNSTIMTPELLQIVVETIHFVENIEDTNIANISMELSTKITQFSDTD